MYPEHRVIYVKINFNIRPMLEVSRAVFPSPKIEKMDI
jgi:hypothetical protein